MSGFFTRKCLLSIYNVLCKAENCSTLLLILPKLRKFRCGYLVLKKTSGKIPLYKF